MRKIKFFVGATLIASLFSACYVSARPPCHTDCYWSYGRQICQRNCY